MSGLSIFSAFPAAGPSSWALGDKPVWRGGTPANAGWWHPKSVFAADFVKARYARQGANSDFASAFSFARSSTALLADASGIRQTFAADALARISGVGAYIGGASTQLLTAPSDFSNAAWTKSAGCVVAEETGYQTLSDTSASVMATFTQRVAHAADTQVRTAWVLLRKDSVANTARALWFDCPGDGSGRRRLVLINTATGAYAASFATLSEGALAVRDLGYAWLVSCAYVNNGSATSVQIIVIPARRADIGDSGSTPSLTGSVSVYGSGVIVGTAFPPFLSGAKLADDLRAAASGSDPFAGFAAGNLGNGLSILAAVNLSRSGDGAVRPVAEFSDGTATNRLRFYIDSDDRPAAQVVSGGSVLATAKLSVVLTPGRAVLAATYDPASGLYLACKTGLAEASAALSGMPSGLAALRLGSSLGGNYLNDLVEQMQVCRPLSQAEAKDWVQTA
ncbi:MAG TPA: hypothetical protein VGN05_04750 [Parvibaculum sp.]